MRNFEFIQLCIMAGFNLYDEEECIRTYLDNTHFCDQELINNNQNNDNLREEEYSDLIRFDDIDQNTSEILNIQFVNGHSYAKKNPFYGNNHTIKTKKEKEKNEKKIYSLIKYYFKNPLSLKELSRNKIRSELIRIDFKIKLKIEKTLDVPDQLKRYLLFSEFNL